MASLGALVIELAANTARLQGDLGKAVSMAQGAANRFSSIFRGVAALAGASSLGAVVARSIEMGDSLNKAAIKAGIGGKAISELAFAARMADVELSGLSTSLKFMQKNLSEAATGSKGVNTALAALGLTVADLKGLAADQQFEILGDRISRLKDPADRARAATELFGKAGADLLPLFEQGAQGIRKAREEAQRLGLSFGDDQLKTLADADDAVKRLRGAWEGFATALTIKVAPAISGALDLLRGKAPGVAEDPIQRRVDQLKREIADLERFDQVDEQRGLSQADVARVLEQLSTARRELRALTAAGRGARGASSGNAPGYEAAINSENELTEIIVGGSKIRVDALEKYYSELDEFTMSSTERQIAYLNEMEVALMDLRAAGRISAEEYAERWSEALGTVIHEIEPAGKRLADLTKKPVSEMQEFALQAARNIQDAFANFLFDPFANGLKGMLKGFINVIRRMVAEVAAANIFKGFGGVEGIGSFLGNILSFGGGKAKGGPLEQGKWYIAGEHGPEPIWGGGAGAFAAGYGKGGGGGISIVNNVDMRGATQEAMKMLPAILERNNAKMRAEFTNMIRGGAFA